MCLVGPPGRGVGLWSWGRLCSGHSCFSRILLSLTHWGSLVFASGLTGTADSSKCCLSYYPIWLWLSDIFFYPNFFPQNIWDVPWFFLWSTQELFIWDTPFLGPHYCLRPRTSVAVILVNGQRYFFLGGGAESPQNWGSVFLDIKSIHCSTFQNLTGYVTEK